MRKRVWMVMGGLIVGFIVVTTYALFRPPVWVGEPTFLKAFEKKEDFQGITEFPKSSTTSTPTVEPTRLRRRSYLAEQSPDEVASGFRTICPSPEWKESRRYGLVRESTKDIFERGVFHSLEYAVVEVTSGGFPVDAHGLTHIFVEEAVPLRWTDHVRSWIDRRFPRR